MQNEIVELDVYLDECSKEVNYLEVNDGNDNSFKIMFGIIKDSRIEAMQKKIMREYETL